MLHLKDRGQFPYNFADKICKIYDSTWCIYIILDNCCVIACVTKDEISKGFTTSSKIFAPILTQLMCKVHYQRIIFFHFLHLLGYTQFKFLKCFPYGFWNKDFSIAFGKNVLIYSCLESKPQWE